MATRIELHDSLMDIGAKMCQGNSNALGVIMRILVDGERIDPDNIMGGVGSVLMMDTLNIYDQHIWRLFKDVCMEDLTLTIAMLRGVQLGIISRDELTRNLFVDGRPGMSYDRKIEILNEVQTRLPKFGRMI